MGVRTWLGLKKLPRRYSYKRYEVAAAPADARLRPPKKWTEFVHLRHTGEFADMPWLNKREMREVIESCGLRTPAIYRTFVGAEQLDFTGLPDTFVLKPLGLSNKRGVMLLRQLGENTFFECFRGSTITTDEIRAEQAEWESLWRASREEPFEMIAEEFVRGENGRSAIPLDYKLYAFGGEVRFIQQIDRNVSPRTEAYWINEFEPFEYETRMRTPWKANARGEPLKPRCHREMIAAASAISLKLRTGFVRVDMYATPDGPMVGELTKIPGAPYYGRRWSFLPAFDEELGRAWAEANERLNIEPPLIDDAVPLVRKRTDVPLELPGKAQGDGQR